MHTVNSLAKLLTDPKSVMQKLKDTLREVDPEYEKKIKPLSLAAPLYPPVSMILLSPMFKAI